MKTYKIAIKFKDGAYWDVEELGLDYNSEQIKITLDQLESMGKKTEITSMLTNEKRLYEEVETIEIIL